MKHYLSICMIFLFLSTQQSVQAEQVIENVQSIFKKHNFWYKKYYVTLQDDEQKYKKIYSMLLLDIVKKALITNKDYTLTIKTLFLMGASLEITKEKTGVLAPDSESFCVEDCQTALFKAVNAGDYDLVEFLLTLGADPNAPGAHRQTPLHDAFGGYSCSELLENYQLYAKIIKLLLAYGASVTQLDDSSMDAFDFAKKHHWGDYFINNTLKKTYQKKGADIHFDTELKLSIDAIKKELDTLIDTHLQEITEKEEEKEEEEKSCIIF